MSLWKLILLEIRQQWLTIPYRGMYGAQHHRPRRGACNRINKERSKVSKDQKNRPHNNVKEGNDRSVGLQLLANPFDSRPRFAEKFIVERDPTKFRNLILSLPAEHEVNRFSDGLRVAAVP